MDRGWGPETDDGPVTSEVGPRSHDGRMSRFVSFHPNGSPDPVLGDGSAKRI